MFRFAVVGTALAFALVAHAKSSIQGQVLASAGWDNNVLGVPADQNPQQDAIFEIRPSLILPPGTARLVNRLSYTFDATLFATATEADSYTQRLDWTGFFQTSKTTDLLVLASFQQGRLNTFNLTTGSAAQPIGVQPGGGVTFLGGTASESLGWD